MNDESRPEAAHEKSPTKATEARIARPADSRTDARPTFSERIRRHRSVAAELDRLLGIWPYPDPSVTYASAPSREPDEVEAGVE